MTLKSALSVLLLWQSSLVLNLGAPAAPEHLRFERTVLLPASAQGVACVALDAAVLTHTASAAHNDLRIYRGYPGSAAQAEVPYLLTESGPEPVDAMKATPEHVTRKGDGIRFDLHMPSRAFSELQLALNAHDFLGTVTVTGDTGHGGTRSLGSFAIYDLRSLELGRWTNLLMAESTSPVLHVTLALRTLAGQPVQDLSLGIVESVAVPPSRERQTVYTPVASTKTFAQEGSRTVATLHVPAHVPVEELQITPSPGNPNFAREVVLSARTDDDPFNDPEVLDAGMIQSVRMPSGDPGLNPIDVEETGVPATLGATLASAATVTVTVENGGLPPLSLAVARLLMRERRLCFAVREGATYTLRYGDIALAAPLYANLPELGSTEILGGLGPERRNPHWRRRVDSRRFLDRHPELFWLILLVCAGTMGGTALQFVQYRQGDLRG